ncbi:hypothetical protein [Methylophilus sp. DW102]|uniref:hypothetical protein n=1 Tax=Methylophilus sp. DW102 TaxID=3095607 RepID=UPI00309044AF|nr:hypothetical protein MTDW_10910 [Methylophilus sp. DW102]
MKERFHAAYAAAWLWASDGVLIALNHFVALQIQHTNTPSSIDQSTLKNAYRAVVVEMRKDVGFGSTVASGNEYQFVKF